MANGISRKGIDVAGGVGIDGSSNVFANGAGVMRDGDRVASHPPPIPLHTPTPPMIAQSNQVFANGILVVNEGDLAICGHAISGSSNVFVGG